MAEYAAVIRSNFTPGTDFISIFLPKSMDDDLIAKSEFVQIDERTWTTIGQIDMRSDDTITSMRRERCPFQVPRLTIQPGQIPVGSIKWYASNGHVKI